MKIADRNLILRIAEKENRTKAIKEAGISKALFYLSAHAHVVDIRRHTSPYKLSPEDRELIYQLATDKKSTLSYREIGEKFEVSHTTIRRCVNSHA